MEEFWKHLQIHLYLHQVHTVYAFSIATYKITDFKHNSDMYNPLFPLTLKVQD